MADRKYFGLTRETERLGVFHAFESSVNIFFLNACYDPSFFPPLSHFTQKKSSMCPMRKKMRRNFIKNF